MIVINERFDDQPLIKAGFKQITDKADDSNVYCYSTRNKNTDLVFTGFIIFSDVRYVGIGISYNTDIGFEPHFDKAFVDHFNKYHCKNKRSEHIPFNMLKWSSVVSLSSVTPTTAIYYLGRHNPKKSNIGMFINSIVLASKEMDHFMTNFIYDGDTFTDTVYKPRFLNRPPVKTFSTKQPLSYSRKLRR